MFRVKRILEKVTFDREREYRGLKIGSWKLPEGEESLFGLSVSKMRGGGLFLGMGRKILRVTRTLKPVPVDLAG